MPVQPLGPTGLLAQTMTLPAGSQSLSMGGMGLRAQGMDGRKKGRSSAHWFSIVGNANTNEPKDIAVDGLGNVWVSGIDYRAGSNSSLIFRLDASGQLRVSNGLDASGNNGFNTTSIATDSAGGVFICGDVVLSTLQYLYFIRSNLSGSIELQRTARATGSSPAAGYAIKVAPSGAIYVGAQVSIFSPFSGGFSIVKYNQSGAIDWARVVAVTGNMLFCDSLSIDAAENVYGCSNRNGFVNPGYIAKVDSSGAIQFQKSTTGLNTRAIVAAPSGRFYVAGKDFSGGAVLVCFDASGSQQWARTLGAGTFSAAALDASGNVYVCGTCDQGLGRGDDILLAKYSPAGVLLWQRLISGPGTDLGIAIAVVGSDVYFAGRTSLGAGNDDILVGKIPDDGSKTGVVGELIYSASRLTDSAWSYAETSPGLSNTTAAPLESTPSFTTSAIALTTSTGRF